MPSTAYVVHLGITAYVSRGACGDDWLRHLLRGRLVVFRRTAFGARYVLNDDAQAQARNEDTWQIAGGPEGFSVADWGTGAGNAHSLDE